MGRVHLFEIIDHPGCPESLRRGVTDVLEHFLRTNHLYRATAPILARAMARTGDREVLDLCSGGGGPWLPLSRNLSRRMGFPVKVTLSDKFPNPGAVERTEKESDGLVRSHPEPVDAADVPPDLMGFRTIFSSFHHFDWDLARSILSDAVEKNRGIAVFEFTRRALPWFVGFNTIPFWILANTPFIRPVTAPKLAFTYGVPAIPFTAWFDGMVSCLRTYSKKELLELTKGLDRGGYTWEVGNAWAWQRPLPILYLVGTPGPCRTA